MNMSFIKLSTVSLLVFFSIGLSAQQNHFIYLQTENKQPFYVKLDKKLLSSSASGYLIIPKLTDGSYRFTIGFPKNEWPEQSITCTINKKDAGYILKDFGNKGWGLFNLQTLDVVMLDKKITDNTTLATAGKTDDFSNTLSKVVNDPSIIKKEEVKPVIKLEEIKLVGEIKKEEPVKPVTQITKLLSSNGAEGTEMIYIDVVNGRPDTVWLVIPLEKDTLVTPPEKKIEEPKPEAKKEEVKNSDAKFIDVTLPTPNAKMDNTATQSAPIIINEKKADVVKAPENSKEDIIKPVMLNSDCKSFAAEEDFLKLRKKMAAENNDDEMVAIAKKIFKSKCFTTDQVKNLSVLFLKDEGKYKFFDAAYPFVSDSYNFDSLETQLTDIYFINRFKVMLKH